MINSWIRFYFEKHWLLIVIYRYIYRDFRLLTLDILCINLISILQVCLSYTLIRLESIWCDFILIKVICSFVCILFEFLNVSNIQILKRHIVKQRRFYTFASNINCQFHFSLTLHEKMILYNNLLRFNIWFLGWCIINKKKFKYRYEAKEKINIRIQSRELNYVF